MSKDHHEVFQSMTPSQLDAVMEMANKAWREANAKAKKDDVPPVKPLDFLDGFKRAYSARQPEITALTARTMEAEANVESSNIIIIRQRADFKDLCASNDGFIAKIAELQAIVDIRPKTADGVVCVEGMELFCCDCQDKRVFMQAAILEDNEVSCYEPKELYSTHSAAIAAQSKPTACAGAQNEMP